MKKVITRLFDNYSDAQAAVADMERMGVPRDDISLIANNADGRHDHHGPHSTDDGAVSRGAGKGASVGGVLGGGAGLLAGLGVLAIPGVGPVVAAGWLITTLVGAAGGAVAGGAAGGLAGVLKHAGESEEDAHIYSEGVRRGATLVSAKVDDTLYANIEAALRRFNAKDAATRSGDYPETGGAYREKQEVGRDMAGAPYMPSAVPGERRTPPGV